jgi:uncharacterized RDD family membrane protein YckC/cytoskeletal protein CcmA (bactofilin family)
MKTYRSLNLTTLLLGVALALGPALRAQTAAPAPTEPAAATVTTPKEEPPKPEPSEKKTVAPQATDQAGPTTAPTPAVTKTDGEDENDDDAKMANDEKKSGETEKAAEAGSAATTEPNKKQEKSGSHHQYTGRSDNARVSLFHDSTLAAGEQAEAVVSILGSSTSAGEVNDAVVSVLGSSTSSGHVGNAVVSVLGNTRVTGGTVGDAAVAVLGSNYINGHIRGEVVAVLGNVELGPEAVVDGEIVCVGGEVQRDPNAVVHGNVQHIAIGGHWLNAWVTKCLLYGRPLAFDAGVMWAWWIALACLGFYALVALIAPQGVTKCVQTLEERPGYSILSAVLAMLLTPVAYVLLVLTLAIVIGFLLIPLFSLGLFFASLFGKVVMLAWLGRRITKLFGEGPLAHPVFGVLIGGVIVLGLYTLPVVGFIVYKLIGLLGLGVVLYTLLRSIKSRRPVAPVPAGAPAAAGSPGVPPVLNDAAAATTVPAAAGVTLPPVISAATLPRAGFWLRLAASLIDLILVAIVFGMLRKMLFGLGGAIPLWLVIYAVVMWATKGTTIGGIICGLKVVRIDDRPLDWSVAIVRGLSAFLSLAVLGLGFIWVAFDDDKQSWHDKIAGTTIVQVPKGTPLL